MLLKFTIYKVVIEKIFSKLKKKKNEFQSSLSPARSLPEIFLTIQKSAERRRVIMIKQAMKEEVRSQPNMYRVNDITLNMR